MLTGSDDRTLKLWDTRNGTRCLVVRVVLPLPDGCLPRTAVRSTTPRATL